MPAYDYFYEANQKTVEVQHPMDCDVQTWGELCKLAKIESGKTPRTAKVSKLFNGGYTTGSASSEVCQPETYEAPPSIWCGGGACGLN